jgi:hypothetical protein
MDISAESRVYGPSEVTARPYKRRPPKSYQPIRPGETRSKIPKTKYNERWSIIIYINTYKTTAQRPTPAKEEHHEGVNARGDQAMGFSHEKTTHHFHLLTDGGSIEIQSNEPTDAASQDAIRQHLSMIAAKFSQGDFAIPMFIHATNPPGVEDMKRLKSKITYQAENTEHGAQLRITYPQLPNLPDP